MEYITQAHGPYELITDLKWGCSRMPEALLWFHRRFSCFVIMKNPNPKEKLNGEFKIEKIVQRSQIWIFCFYVSILVKPRFLGAATLSAGNFGNRIEFVILRIVFTTTISWYDYLKDKTELKAHRRSVRQRLQMTNRHRVTD